MDTLLSTNFWFFAVIWVISSFLIFLVPGIVVQKYLKLELPTIARFVLALALGLCFWGLQGYILGYLQLRFLTYAYVAFCLLILVLQRNFVLNYFTKLRTEVLKLDLFVVLLMLAGMVLQGLQMFGTGLVSSLGMAFWRVNMQDGIYHQSLITTMVRAFPPLEPGFAGHLLINYHYWSDLIFADQVRIFHIPVQNLFFQFSPVLFSIATSLAVYALLKTWGASKLVIRFGLFFLLFGSDAGFIATFIIHQVFNFQYPVIDSGVLQFLNMPHVVAKFVFITSLVPLHHWLKEKSWKWGSVTILLTTILFGLKIYFALYAVLGLAVVGLIVLARRDWKLVRQMLVFGICGAVGALAIYLPPNHGSGGLTYVPLAWPNLMLAVGNLDWTNWRYKLAVAQLSNLRFKIYFYDFEAIVMTLLAVHGTRLLGFLVGRKTAKSLGFIWITYLLVPTFIFTILGLYTMQVSGGYNVYNFFAMSLTLLALLSAYLMSEIWQWRFFIGKILVVGVLLLTLPRGIYETQKILASYRDQTDVLYITKAEISTLSLANSVLPKNCLMATSPANEVDMKTPYVSYLSNRITYMSGQSVLETHNQPSLERYTQYRDLFSKENGKEILSTLQSHGVCALYLQKQDVNFGKIMASNPKLYFENDLATVIKVE